MLLCLFHVILKKGIEIITFLNIIYIYMDRVKKRLWINPNNIHIPNHLINQTTPKSKLLYKF